MYRLWKVVWQTDRQTDASVIAKTLEAPHAVAHKKSCAVLNFARFDSIVCIVARSSGKISLAVARPCSRLLLLTLAFWFIHSPKMRGRPADCTPNICIAICSQNVLFSDMITILTAYSNLAIPYSLVPLPTYCEHLFWVLPNFAWYIMTKLYQWNGYC